MSVSLFTYGTLMFAEVWRRIAIGEFRSQPATLRGFAVYRLRDSVIPGMVYADADSLSPGVVYHDIDEETLFELDAYESDLYQRISVRVTTEDGSAVDCQAYVIPDRSRQALTDEPWDAAWFEQNELESYLRG
ncbi:MAG: gamma-glutamylcyclotransferase [Planctomycetales bacterium]|nr:gamma-glutamylcyclotransferase [Planctomycetales bacterium]